MVTRTLLAVCCILACGAPVLGGAIIGSVRGEDGRPVVRTPVRAFAVGRGIGEGTVTDNEGRYSIPDLAPGRYAVCACGSEHSSPQVASVSLTGDEPVQVDFAVGWSVSVEGDSWTRALPVFHQSFRATGIGLTCVRLKAFGPSRRVRVQLLQGSGPGGKPIGPSRTTVAFGGEGDAAVYWSAGEAPTTPGAVYTLRLSADLSQSWIPGVAGRGDVFPTGSAWFGGDYRPLTDLGFAIRERNESLSPVYAVGAGRRAIRVRAVGQTFVARGPNVLYASAHLQPINSRSVYVRFSLHENGPGGKQVGPSKGTGVGPDSAVAWLPGEVNVTAGKTYYLHVESFDGALFHAFEVKDSYVKGCAFNDAIGARDMDLSGWIAGDMPVSEQNALLRTPGAVGVASLANPSFENGMTGWTLGSPVGSVTECDAGVIPPWGRRMFGWTNRGKGEGSRTVVYQSARAKKGKRYSFSGSVYTSHEGGRSSDQKIRLVADVAGSKPSDGPSTQSSQWYATEGQWRRGSMQFVAGSDVVTVGFELEQRWSLDRCSLYVDCARLEEVREQ